MIIRSLRALNLFKYDLLQLSDLPAEGTVLVTGPNESGKSSVGEAICLALFGRSHSLQPDDLDHAVRWDQRDAEVDLVFEDKQGRPWSLSRRIELRGERSASLAPFGDSSDRLRGWAAVTAEVARLIGFDYSQYVESFYLARREIGPAGPRAETVRQMAGIAELERAARAIEGDVESEEGQRTRLAVEIEDARQRLERVDPTPLLGRIPGSPPIVDPNGDDDEGSAALVSAVSDRIDRLKGLRVELAERYPALAAAARRLADAGDSSTASSWTDQTRTVRRELAAVSKAAHRVRLLDTDPGLAPIERALAAVRRGLDDFGALAGTVEPRRKELSGLLGRSESAGTARPFADRIEELGVTAGRADRAFRMLSIGAVATAVVALVVGVGAELDLIPPLERLVELAPRIIAGVLGIGAAWLAWRAASERERGLEARNEQVEVEQARAVAERQVALLDRFDALPLKEGLSTLTQAEEPSITRAVEAFRSGAGRALVDQSSRARVGDALRAAADDLDARRDAVFSRLDEDVAELASYLDLDGLRDGLEQRLEQAEDGIVVGRLALELISGAAQQLGFDFNARVRKGMASILPGLTEGRYQYLRIEDDLSVRVFSSEKQDFVAFEEISGGTQRQIALATRLALSDSLADRARTGSQFLFLDEPFAFFDAERTRGSVAALSRVSPLLNQIWIAAQVLPVGVEPDLHLVCDRDSRVLTSEGVVSDVPPARADDIDDTDDGGDDDVDGDGSADGDDDGDGTDLAATSQAIRLTNEMSASPGPPLGSADPADPPEASGLPSPSSPASAEEDSASTMRFASETDSI